MLNLQKNGQKTIKNRDNRPKVYRQENKILRIEKNCQKFTEKRKKNKEYRNERPSLSYGF